MVTTKTKQIQSLADDIAMKDWKGQADWNLVEWCGNALIDVVVSIEKNIESLKQKLN